MKNYGSMLVWIPRYSYKITSKEHAATSTTTAGTIGIKFSNGTTDDLTNGYIKHPGFTFGTDIKGIWVGKFESSSVQGNANTIAGDNVTTKTVQIKPNVASWKNISVSTIFATVRNMEKTSIYGWIAQTGTLGTTGNITGDTNNFDTHMMKNSEWGAVAYLTHSIGKTGEVWINPNKNFITGHAGDSVSAKSAESTTDYKSTNGIHASTTDNVYGIYDMSGGAYEYVMGALSTGISGGTPTINSSGFSTVPNAKYYDLYVRGATENQANNYEANSNKKGDSTYETSSAPDGMSAWYGDQCYYLNQGLSKSWFRRGGIYLDQTNAGLFYFVADSGEAYSNPSFRVVVSSI